MINYYWVTKLDFQKSKLLCVVCNEIPQFKNNKKKAFKIFEKGFENSLFDQLRVEFCNTINFFTHVATEPCHMDTVILDDRYLSDQIFVVGEFFPHLIANKLIDQFDRFQLTGKHPSKKGFIPLFKRLLKNGMISVIKAARGYFPC